MVALPSFHNNKVKQYFWANDTLNQLNKGNLKKWVAYVIWVKKINLAFGFSSTSGRNQSGCGKAKKKLDLYPLYFEFS